MSRVVAFRLISGEEIIGQIDDENDDYIVLVKVRRIIDVITARGIVCALVPLWRCNQNLHGLTLPTIEVESQNEEIEEHVMHTYVQSFTSIALPGNA